MRTSNAMQLKARISALAPGNAVGCAFAALRLRFNN